MINLLCTRFASESFPPKWLFMSYTHFAHDDPSFLLNGFAKFKDISGRHHYRRCRLLEFNKLESWIIWKFEKNEKKKVKTHTEQYGHNFKRKMVPLLVISEYRYNIMNMHFLSLIHYLTKLNSNNNWENAVPKTNDLVCLLLQATRQY